MPKLILRSLIIYFTLMWIWQHSQTYPSRSYKCGYCGKSLASEKGYQATDTNTGRASAYIYICHYCERPTFFDDTDRSITPGSIYGESVNDVTDANVLVLYNEARKAAGEGLYTSAVLACRKLLMHIAVAKGADAGQLFITYVEYLATNNFIPPDAKEWVDHIPNKGERG